MLTLFASDLHLSPDRPDSLASFVRLARGPARRASALYLLGDVFDQWLGDDDTTPPHPEAEEELRMLCDAGVRVGFTAGNHDFLLGRDFAARTGVTLLDEVTVIDLEGRRTIVTHGDQLCTADTDYQAFRAHTRDRSVQRGFLALPLPERARMAAQLRHRSRELTALKPDDIMDVAPEAVEALLREHRADDLIHGHTHRPATHHLIVDGRDCRRLVLADWYAGDSVLAVENGEYRNSPVAALSRPPARSRTPRRQALS